MGYDKRSPSRLAAFFRRCAPSDGCRAQLVTPGGAADAQQILAQWYYSDLKAPDSLAPELIEVAQEAANESQERQTFDVLFCEAPSADGDGDYGEPQVHGLRITPRDEESEAPTATGVLRQQMRQNDMLVAKLLQQQEFTVGAMMRVLSVVTERNETLERTMVDVLAREREAMQVDVSAALTDGAEERKDRVAQKLLTLAEGIATSSGASLPPEVEELMQLKDHPMIQGLLEDMKGSKNATE